MVLAEIGLGSGDILKPKQKGAPTERPSISSAGWLGCFLLASCHEAEADETSPMAACAFDIEMVFWNVGQPRPATFQLLNATLTSVIPAAKKPPVTASAAAVKTMISKAEKFRRGFWFLLLMWRLYISDRREQETGLVLSKMMLTWGKSAYFRNGLRGG